MRRPLRTARRSRSPHSLLLHLATALAAVLLVAVAAPAQAADAPDAKRPQTLCKTFADCEAKGYSTRGYRPVYTQSFWGSSPGHNCTNYVAYRLNSNGRLTDRASKTGNASEWGINFPAEKIATEQTTPRVGDVAWWSYHRGNARPNHVAYVEHVYADGSVLVSEDNYHGEFYFTRYYKGHSTFPSSFLRFRASDGTPYGFTSGATTLAGVTKLSAYTREADAAGTTTLVTWGGARGVKGVVEQRTSKPIAGNWWMSRTFALNKVPKVAYVYALNTAKTGGATKLLGKVSIPGGKVAELKAR